MSDIENLLRNVCRNVVPPQAKDEDAFRQLGALVDKTASELLKLGQNPVAVAASPSRFNDAWNTQDWIAVRCGAFFSENEGLGRHDFPNDIATASSEVKAAYATLLELESAGWRDLFGKAFGFRWDDQSLSMVVQNGMTWLIFSSNNFSEDGDPVFSIGEPTHLSYVGEAEDRFDWAIQNPIPLVFRRKSSPADDHTA